MRRKGDLAPGAKLGLLSMACLGALCAVPALAVEFRAGQHVLVGSDEVIPDDLYVTGESVTVDGRIEGDLITSGREIRLNGEVTGDFMAGGQAVVVNGRVGDDIRMAGMALQLGPEADVGDDVISAGLSLETRPDSLTRGVLLFSGFQALLAGRIDESLRGTMSALEIRGAIGGDSSVEVEGKPDDPAFVHYLPSPIALPVVPGGLTIADSARIDGTFEYASATEARGRGAGSGTLSRREPAADESEAAPATRTSPWPGRLLKWLGLVALGLLLAWWMPGWLEARSGDVRSKPLPMAGVGLLGVAALPVTVSLVLLISVIVAMLLGALQLGNLAALAVVLGLAVLALVTLAFWLATFYLAPVIVGLCAGRWVLERVAAGKTRGLVPPLLAGIVLLALLRFVPYLGILVALAVLLLGWGAILAWLWERRRHSPAAAA